MTDFEQFANAVREQIVAEEADEAADAAWRAEVNRIADRHASIDYLERLRDADYDQYCREGGGDRLLRLLREGGE